MPAFFNGMATGADWMSAASFIGMAGTLYLLGYGGLAFILGWTGGFCWWRSCSARTCASSAPTPFRTLASRYGGNLPRLIGVVAPFCCSFTYVVAQIYGVGLITARFTGVSSRSGCSSASAASWSARSWAACAR